MIYPLICFFSEHHGMECHQAFWVGARPKHTRESAKLPPATNRLRTQVVEARNFARNKSRPSRMNNIYSESANATLEPPATHILFPVVAFHQFKLRPSPPTRPPAYSFQTLREWRLSKLQLRNMQLCTSWQPPLDLPTRSSQATSTGLASFGTMSKNR